MQKSILVCVGRDCLGDAIQKVPYINALREAFPEHKLVWFANQNSVFSGLVKDIGDELLDEVISDIDFSSRFFDLFKNPFKGTPLENREFDYVFDTQGRWKQTLMLKKIKHKHFVSGCAGFLFSDIKPKKGYQSARNVTKRLINMTSVVTGDSYATNYSVPVPSRVIDEAQKLLPLGKRYMGFVPCAAMPEKKWPLQNYIEVALHYKQRGFAPVFFLGPEEQSYKSEIVAAIPDVIIPGLMVVNKADSLYGPLYYMALGQQLTAIVTNDCGPGHILNCANRPMIFLFGPTDAEKFAPERDGITILQSKTWGSLSPDAIPVDAVYGAMQVLAPQTQSTIDKEGVLV
ncbi:MAG: hypothetical protein COB66_09360 [Coxiella sp. (in: Bacteria)]|nr:MAG: hypothetical protein COB66_09360 [Coxiella sp. (in: g-proteobacteria)]